MKMEQCQRNKGVHHLVFILCFIQMQRPVQAFSALELPCTYDVLPLGSSSGLKYDLCPLLSPPNTQFQVISEENTPPTYTSYTYNFGFEKGGIHWDGTLPSDLQVVVVKCPDKYSELNSLFNPFSVRKERWS